MNPSWSISRFCAQFWAWLQCLPLAELLGYCPEHLTSLTLFGDASDTFACWNRQNHECDIHQGTPNCLPQSRCPSGISWWRCLPRNSQRLAPSSHFMEPLCFGTCITLAPQNLNPRTLTLWSSLIFLSPCRWICIYNGEDGEVSVPSRCHPSIHRSGPQHAWYWAQDSPQGPQSRV